MTRARMWPLRAMYTIVAAALVISLMITAAPPPAEAAPGGTVKAEWERVDTPSMDGMVLAPGSVIHDYAVAAGGQVAYAIVEGDYERNGYESDWWLLRSTTHAATWRDINRGIEKELDEEGLGETILDDVQEMLMVATDGHDPDFLAVALRLENDDVHVFFSHDGGTRFHDAGRVEDGGETLANVYALAVSPKVGDMRSIIIAGDGGLIFGTEVFGRFSTGWDWLADPDDDWDDDGDITSVAVVDIKFAPDWVSENTILAVSVTATGGTGRVYLQSGTWGSSIRWNEDAGFKPAVRIAEEFIPGQFITPEIGPRFIAGMALPSDYSGDTAGGRYAWVWVNYGTPGNEEATIFRVRDALVDEVNAQIPGQPWVSHVDYLGDISSGKTVVGLLGDGEGRLAGVCEGVRVWRNAEIASMDICCPTWETDCKSPTGNSVMAAFYVRADKVYAVALGPGAFNESAWSWSFDDGETWNQLSLIDTQIDFLSDVAVSPNCNKTMLVSINARQDGCDSVWYHAKDLAHYGFNEYNGVWHRTWARQLGDEQHGMLRLNPEEDDGRTVYLVDRGTNTIYYNDMQTLACWSTRTSTIDEIADLAVKNQRTIYAIDVNGEVAMSDDYGRFVSWTDPEDSELDNGWTIAVWGDEILVGSEDGHVAYSSHGTGNFTKLTEEFRARLPIEGVVTVAFDSYYGANDTIYAATAAEGLTGGIYRWIVGESTEWFDMRATPSTRQLIGPGGNKFDTNRVAYTGLVLDDPDGNPKTSATTGGVLYASYVGVVDGQLVTGAARMLTPALDYCCDETEWDYLIQTEDNRILNQEAFYFMPNALKICGCLSPNTNTRIFAIDGLNPYDMDDADEGTVWMFEDCYSKSGPNVRSPADGAHIHSDPCDGCLNSPFTIEWDRMCDACNYEFEFALDRDFRHIFPVPGFPAPDILSCIARPGHEVRPVPAMNPSAYIPSWFTPGETYYWRVRSVMAENNQTIRSWWSEERSFTINLRATDGVYLVSPEPGTTNVARTDIGFTWGASVAVDTYRFELSQNADLSSPVESPATGLTRTSYKYTGPNLDYDQTYFWRVTAYRDGDAISMSTGQFRTVPEEPVEPDPEPIEIVTPAWVWVLIAIGAVLVIVVIVLIFRTRRV